MSQGRLLSICRLIHSSTSDSIQPTALAPKDTGLGLGDHLKAAIRYHFKTGHREAA